METQNCIETIETIDPTKTNVESNQHSICIPMSSELKKPFTLKSSKIPYRMKCYAAMFYSNYIESIAGEPRASHSPLMTSLWTFRVDKVGFIRPPEK